MRAPTPAPRLPDLGFVRKIWYNTKLISRLMMDDRVSPLLKILPIIALVYWLSPIDLVPEGLAMFISPFCGLASGLDDAAVLWLLNNLFVLWSPKEIVGQYQKWLDEEFSKTG